ncbi:hypothetical protein AHAS_Ahas04G0139900 [Arachis hypogaea]
MGYYSPSPTDYSNGGWEYHQEITDSEHSNHWRYASKPQDEQENHIGYCPPPQYDLIHYPNGGWEYYQELTNSEQPNQWGFASENDQDNFIRYCPPPQDDLGHYPHGDWEYQQGMREYEQSSEINYFPEPQSDSYYCDTYTNHGWEGNYNDSHSNHSKTLSHDYAVSTYMEDYSSIPQNNPHCDEFNNHSSCGWQDQNQTAFNRSYSTHQETSSLECTFNKFMQDCPPMPQDDPYYDECNNSSSCAWEDQNQRALNVSYSINQEPSSLEQTFNSFMQSCSASPPRFPIENPSSLDYTSTQSLLQDTYNSFHQPQDTPDYSQNSSHIPQHKFTTISISPQNPPQSGSLLLQAEKCLQSAIDSKERTTEFLERQEQSWKEQETLFKKMDGHLEQMRRNLELLSKKNEDQLVNVKEEVEKQEEEAPVSSKLSMKNEVVEVFEPETALEMTREHENSQPSQTSLNQRVSTHESVVDRYE